MLVHQNRSCACSTALSTMMMRHINSPEPRQPRVGVVLLIILRHYKLFGAISEATKGFSWSWLLVQSTIAGDVTCSPAGFWHRVKNNQIMPKRFHFVSFRVLFFDFLCCDGSRGGEIGLGQASFLEIHAAANEI